MEAEAKSGIYKISFKGSEKFYIGSALNLNKRKSNHLSDLKNQKHCNIIMQRCFNKYDSFIFEVLEYCSKTELIQKEQFYIDTLLPQVNVCKKANNSLGYRHSDETIDRLKIINKENANNLKTKQKTSKTWFKKGHKTNFTPEQIKKRAESYKGYKHREESKRKMSERKKKKVLQLSLNGSVVNEFDSVTEAYSFLGITTGRCIVDCCNGRRQEYKGSKWKFATEQQRNGK